MATFPRGHNARLVLERHVTVTVSTQPQAKVHWQITAADALTLRGIPAIGRGVAGAVPGTNPQTAVS